MLLTALLLIVGLVVLYYGAEFLVAGASKIALSFGVSPMIVGLTVVAFATSAPEFVVSLTATLQGTSDIAVGNVVGSNIANIALIVGVASAIFPMAVERSVFARDYPLMLLISFGMMGLAVAGRQFTAVDELLLLAVLVFFLGLCTREAVRQNREFRETGAWDVKKVERPNLGVQVGKVVLGIAGLVVGARLMVDSAVEIALSFGVSELVIGVSIIAIGTSLPELATSVVAALKKEPDISLGNIIGSNIFNVGFIIGGVSLVSPIPVSAQALAFDLPMVLLISLLLFPLMRRENKVTRADGILLLFVYVGYLVLTWALSTGLLTVPWLPSSSGA